MTVDLRASAQKIQNFLQERDLDIRVIEFQQLTRTADEAASTIGCEVGQIAKTLIFRGKTTGNPIVIIASGKNRVDEKKVEKIHGEAIEKPNADFVLEHTGFSIGGVPPIGYSLPCAPLIDQDLLAYQEVWAAAGTPFAVFCITPQNLFKVANARIADIAKM